MTSVRTVPEDPDLLTRMIADSHTKVVVTDLSRFRYFKNGAEQTRSFTLEAGDEVEVRKKPKPTQSARDRVLYRLLIDLDDLIEASSDVIDEPWFDWARRAAAGRSASGTR